MAKQDKKWQRYARMDPETMDGPVPIHQENTNTILEETMGAERKVWNEKPIPKAYPALDNDLARDNLENDLTMADLQDLR